jgi:hypothetical protein
MRRSSVVELRTLPPLNPENDVTVYIVVEDFGQFGRAFRETDLAEADLGTIVRNTFLAEIGDGFVVGREPSRQPHHLEIAASWTARGWR